MSEKLIGGVFNDPEPTPTLAELAAPVVAMAQAHCTYLDTMRQNDTADANRAALVAFKRALKEADRHAPIPHDALIVEARRLAEILPLENMSAWGHKVTLIADALAAEPYRHALEQRLIGSNLPGLTGDADADLMRFVFHEQEIAGYFCGQLEKDLAAERAARVAAEEMFDVSQASNRRLVPERDAAIARAERAEADLRAAFADAVDARDVRDTLRTQLAEAREEIQRRQEHGND